MAFQFDIDASVSANARDMWRSQIVKAQRAVDLTDDPARGVLEARKCFKRIRALLRLIRPGLPARAWQRENTRFRDLGRQLAASRDQVALADTLDYLVSTMDLGDLSYVKRIQKRLPPSRRSVSSDEAPDSATRTQVMATPSDMMEGLGRTKIELAAADAARQTLNFDDLTERHIIQAYVKTYQAGAKEMATCYRIADDDELFHEWRKRVQHHWRQTALLRRVWPDEMAVRIDLARKTSKALGLDHDLSLLIAYFESPEIGLTRPQRGKLVASARSLQRELRAVAEPLSAWLYAPEPAALGDTVATWWHAAKLARGVDLTLIPVE